MKIRYLHLKNIGVFTDELVSFKACPATDMAEVHIFTGENGTGKTTLLMALASAFYGWKEEWEAPEDEIIVKDEPPKNLPVNTEISMQKRFRYFEDDDNGRFRSEIRLFTDVFSSLYPEGDIDPREHVESVSVAAYPKEYFGENEIRSMIYSDDIIRYKMALTDAGRPYVDFAVVAYSGYRFVKAEKIELLKENQGNPLVGALDFVKTYESFTFNQWLANNLSQRALAKEERNRENARKFEENIKNLSKVISDVIGYRITFKLKYSPPQLVLKRGYDELDFDVLPDGLRSLISWIGDLLMRIDSLSWGKDVTAFERPVILLLDEIEVHLHPAWQRKVLPVVQRLFRNAQIFLSTHSPFVVNSVDNAWVYKCQLDEKGVSKIAEPSLSEDGFSYTYVLNEIFDIHDEFGFEVQRDLDQFRSIRTKIFQSKKRPSAAILKGLIELGRKLASQSEDLQTLVQFELRQLNKRAGLDLRI